ncbi:hypothetical protein IAQ61_000762 [Plenodomus lingam]|uniref:Uncharacterized protein n=1 Tax=Leptosphaeria maculans (strain JN3 / isolate v23.1.3 / race Av1-4-5-6-7-8) TaxID=985895 RepID=E5A667_LEPMJ|nr:predicted protein [Plenodomus lingam JN3]KAH9880471.1 hypothetical protein IAQ61_000762 [Plenodomus lingam]CBX99112.1 predicted protein [Plenodomus lingam JN3]
MNNHNIFQIAAPPAAPPTTPPNPVKRGRGRPKGRKNNIKYDENGVLVPKKLRRAPDEPYIKPEDAGKRKRPASLSSDAGPPAKKEKISVPKAQSYAAGPSGQNAFTYWAAPPVNNPVPPSLYNAGTNTSAVGLDPSWGPYDTPLVDDAWAAAPLANAQQAEVVPNEQPWTFPVEDAGVLDWLNQFVNFDWINE